MSEELNIIQQYNEETKEWRAMGAGYVVNSDGSNMYTPDDIKKIDNDLIEHEADYIHHAGYGAANYTNAKTITLDPIPSGYKEGMTVAFKNITQNTGAVTINVNGLGTKSVLKSNGNALTFGNLKANSIYTVRYNGTNFILQGEGGEYGTAQTGDVLSGKTIGTEDGVKTGTMPNNGTINKTITEPQQKITIPKGYHNGDGYVKGDITDNGAINKTITTQGEQIIVPKGYHNGYGIVEAQFSNLIAENIKEGVNVGGVVGNYEGEVKHEHGNVGSSWDDEGNYNYVKFRVNMEIPQVLLLDRSSTSLIVYDFCYNNGRYISTNTSYIEQLYAEFENGYITLRCKKSISNVPFDVWGF